MCDVRGKVCEVKGWEMVMACDVRGKVCEVRGWVNKWCVMLGERCVRSGEKCVRSGDGRTNGV